MATSEARRASNERWRRRKGMLPRAEYLAEVIKEGNRNNRRRSKAPTQGIAWADSQPGGRGPEWEDALTRTELLRLRGYDV